MKKNAATPKEYAADVRGQYEDLPYPFRDLEKEGKEFHCSDNLSLDALNHYGWGGKRDLRNGVRVLVAGDGTGDGSVFWGEQLRDSISEVVAIDISSASIEVSKARMAKRRLTNITHHHLSILDLPKAGLGTFDIIECSGVLHHLPDPDLGMRALSSVLKDDGMMAIMVYALYGRMSIYLVQSLMKRLVTDDMPRARKVEIAREFLKNVPVGHWLTMNNERFIDEMMWPDGSGIYDLFLHSTDRAYTVPEIYSWLERTGLKPAGFFSDFTSDLLYRPEAYTASPVLHGILRDKPEPERQAIGELMNGNIYKHSFYAAKEKKIPAQLADDMVITYGPVQWMFAVFASALLQALSRAGIGQRVQVTARPIKGAPPLLITKFAHTEALIRLIDGKRTIGEMLETVAGNSGVASAVVKQDLNLLYKEMRDYQLVFLRHHSIPPYINGEEMVQRLNKILAGP